MARLAQFHLRSWGNGCAYELTNQATGAVVAVQGDDALAFEADKMAAEAVFPEKTDDEILLWLWDQCDYGSAAVV